MESDEAAPLVKLMARCTTSPERCFFATWDGYGDGDSTGRPLAFRRSPPTWADLHRWGPPPVSPLASRVATAAA